MVVNCDFLRFSQQLPALVLTRALRIDLLRLHMPAPAERILCARAALHEPSFILNFISWSSYQVGERARRGTSRVSLARCYPKYNKRI